MATPCSVASSQRMPYAAPRKTSVEPPQQLPVEVFGGRGSTAPVAQAGHAVPAIIGDPGGTEALRDPSGSGGVGDGPAIDQDALHNLAALGRAEGWSGGDERFS